MKKIKIKYNNESKTVEILSDGLIFNCTRINGMNISEWCYPFMLKGVKWNGLYEELKEFYDDENFSIVFWGDKNSLEILRKALAEKNIQVEGLENVVNIVYNGLEKTTDITVNGNMFDTTRLRNRTIEEWIHPFKVKNMEWNGIFEELRDYLGTEAYYIQFVGRKADMNLLLERRPDFVEIGYQAPSSSTFRTSSVSSNNNSSASSNPLVYGQPNPNQSAYRPQTTARNVINTQNIGENVEQIKAKAHSLVAEAAYDKTSFLKKMVPVAVALVIIALVIAIPVSIDQKKKKWIDEVFTAYDENAYAAKEKFNNASVEFKGKILSIESDLSIITVISPKSDHGSQHVYCHIMDEKNKDIAKKLKKGDVITIEGTCRPYEDYGSIEWIDIIVDKIES